jgi:outer membrane protein OmpA-like peptidoglycan-associated protein
MNWTMGGALAALAIVGGALAVWAPEGSSQANAPQAELTRVTAERDAAEMALAEARKEIERARNAAAAAKADAEKAVAKARQDAEAALTSARDEANKSVALARAEGDQKLAAAQAEADRAMAALKRETEAQIAAARAEVQKAAAGQKPGAPPADTEAAVAKVRADAEKALADLRKELAQCKTAAEGQSARCAAGGPAAGGGVVTAEAIGRELDRNGSIALYGIEFDTGSSKLTAQSRESLDEVVKLMKKDTKLRLLVVGHTDSEGDFGINRDLSEKRAQAVVADLVKHGVDARRLSSAGVADLAPVSTNDSEEGRARNRRVELVKR